MDRIRLFWLRRTERQRAVLAYVLPLALFLVMIFVVWTYHHHHGVTTPGEARDLMTRVGLASYLAVVMMLALTRSWPMQSLGLLGMLFAGAELKYRFIARQGRQPPPEWERDLVQATFEVAVLFVVLSMLLYGFAHVSARRPRQERSDAADIAISFAHGQLAERAVSATRAAATAVETARVTAEKAEETATIVADLSEKAIAEAEARVPTMVADAARSQMERVADETANVAKETKRLADAAESTNGGPKP